MRLTKLGLALALVALAGCSKQASDSSAHAPMSEAQHDSLLARSTVPGAFVVGRAMAVAGREAGRAAGMDSLSR